jgi:DNA anti-recombination protein RmuC
MSPVQLVPGPYIRRINNDAREDEMEENMQVVGSVLSNLKNMAQDMGSEIEKQNKQLDKITNKVLMENQFKRLKIYMHIKSLRSK